MTLDIPGDDPIAHLTKAIRLHRKLANQAKDDLTNAIPVLSKALDHNSGQSRKIAAIIDSVWNGDLCENLAGLDPDIANAIVAAIAARAHLAGDADDLLRPLTERRAAS